MKIGFLTACLPGVPLEEIVPWAAKNGFKALEVAAWPDDSTRDYQARQIAAESFSKDDARRVRDLLDEHGMEISALAYYDNNLDADQERRTFYHEHLKKVIDAAGLLGCELVGTFVGGRADRTPSEIIKEGAEILRPMIAYASDRGVNLMIENCPMPGWQRFNVPGNYFYSPELWDALFNELGDAPLGINYDPSHLLWLGIDYLDVIPEYADRIYHAHAKDAEVRDAGMNQVGIYGKQLENNPWDTGWWRYRMPGLGDVDWNRVISTLQEHGYDHVLSIEHEDPIWEGSREKVEKGLVLGQRHLAQFVV
jgi:sugar phosphate isomerase/epimerase